MISAISLVPETERGILHYLPKISDYSQSLMQNGSPSLVLLFSYFAFCDILRRKYGIILFNRIGLSCLLQNKATRQSAKDKRKRYG